MKAGSANRWLEFCYTSDLCEKREIVKLCPGSPVKPSWDQFLVLCLSHILGLITVRLLFIWPLPSLCLVGKIQDSVNHCQLAIMICHKKCLCRICSLLCNYFYFPYKVALVCIKDKILTSNNNSHYKNFFTCQELKIDIF